jgi:glutamine phosphoribosylpyrophosphate amidotransferase
LNLEEQRRLEKSVAEHLGADSVTYLSMEGTNKVFGNERCAACFDGNYMVEVDKQAIDEIRNDRMSISCSFNSINN